MIFDHIYDILTQVIKNCQNRSNGEDISKSIKFLSQRAIMKLEDANFIDTDIRLIILLHLTGDIIR